MPWPALSRLAVPLLPKADSLSKMYSGFDKQRSGSAKIT